MIFRSWLIRCVATRASDPVPRFLLTLGMKSYFVFCYCCSSTSMLHILRYFSTQHICNEGSFEPSYQLKPAWLSSSDPQHGISTRRSATRLHHSSKILLRMKITRQFSEVLEPALLTPTSVRTNFPHILMSQLNVSLSPG